MIIDRLSRDLRLSINITILYFSIYYILGIIYPFQRVSNHQPAMIYTFFSETSQVCAGVLVLRTEAEVPAAGWSAVVKLVEKHHGLVMAW